MSKYFSFEVDMASELWQRLRHARRNADLTQSDIGELCGVTRAAVALWESRNSALRLKPKATTLETIAQATGVSLEWLIDDRQNAPDSEPRSYPERPSLLKTHNARKQPAAETEPTSLPEAIPDLLRDGHLFCFAFTPLQVEAKIKRLQQEPESTKGHLVMIGVRPSIEAHCVETAADAFDLLFQILNKK